MKKSETLRGIIPPIISPFNASGNIDKPYSGGKSDISSSAGFTLVPGGSTGKARR
jgi:dihydrodipicolinate synthase/N-acetylneuraminate lyase